MSQISNDWQEALAGEFRKEYYRKLYDFVKEEYSTKVIYPPSEDIFTALHLTPLSKVKVVILGQDPYHDVNQAHGLSFSVLPEQKKIPPSLQNIYKELNRDLGCYIPNNGYLKKWADQGVLMLNTVLTVREHQANSHQGKGWEKFTDEVIRKVNEKNIPVVFILWGSNARSKKKLITNKHHLIIESAHPSPLSCYRGFNGSRPFSRCNEFLKQQGIAPVNWQIRG